MKDHIKKVFTVVKERTRFVQGLVVGLFIMSAFTYAAVTITTFTPATVISSSAVNANFAAIKVKVDELDIGFVAGLSSNFNVSTCGGSMNPVSGTDFESITGYVATQNDGGFNTTTGEYTFPATGVYRFYVEAPATAGIMGYGIELGVYNGSTWAYEYISSPASVVRKFIVGYKIKILAGCGTKFISNYTVTAVVDSTKLTFALKKF